MLADNEAAATPILRSLLDRWPLTVGDKFTLCELFAYQMVRGPRWEREYAEANPEILTEMAAQDTVLIGDREVAVTPENLDHINATISTESCG